jgi:hypothetical protein
LAGTKIIAPLAQGDHDGLCGVYAIINGCRLVLAPRRELIQSELWRLFRSAYHWLDEREELTAAVTRAVGKAAWPQLTRFLCREINEITNAQLTVSKLATSADGPSRVINRIEAAILRGEAPIVFMRGQYRHYSVVCGYTDEHLTLFDSYGYARVRRASLLTRRQEATYHRFHAASVLSVAAAWHD